MRNIVINHLDKYAKFGICSNNDLWNSFPYLHTKSKYHIGSLNRFNDFLDKLNISYSSYEKMMSDLKRLTSFSFKNNFFNKKEFLDFFDNKFDIEDLLNPIKNKFKLINYLDINNDILDRNLEIWTDSECLLINTELIESNNILEELFNT